MSTEKAKRMLAVFKLLNAAASDAPRAGRLVLEELAIEWNERIQKVLGR